MWNELWNKSVLLIKFMKEYFDTKIDAFLPTVNVNLNEMYIDRR